MGRKKLETMNEDIVGQVFSKWTVIRPTERKGKSSTQYYWCKCECGNEKDIARGSLIYGKSKSCCGLEKMYEERTIDITGQMFGKLKVVGKADIVGDKQGTFWECICECGEKHTVASGDLRSGDTKSCGCEAYNRIDKRSFEDPKIVNAHCIYEKEYSDGNLIFEQFLELTAKNCRYCKTPPQNKYNTFRGRITISQDTIDGYAFIYSGLDRIDPKGKHDYENVVPCCIFCNSAKGDMTLDEFRAWKERVYEFGGIKRLLEAKKNGN